MKIIDCLFYASDSLSWDVSWEYIAKLLAAWLYISNSNAVQVRFPMTFMSDVGKKSENQTNGELISVNFLETCKQFINRSFCKIRHWFRPYIVKKLCRVALLSSIYGLQKEVQN